MRIQHTIYVSLFLFPLILGAQQDPALRPAPGYTTVTDTVHYYLNKFYFKTGTIDLKKFPYYKAAPQTSTNISHVGSKFENADTITITGIETYLFHLGFGTLFTPIRLYLCTLDAVSGLPILPALDSIVTNAGSGSGNSPILVGGNFNQPKLIMGDFALLCRNMSTIYGDTIFFLRTASKTNTNTTALSAEKYSDGMGVLRSGLNFYRATDYPGQEFGAGTDYEFMIAPRVKYNLRAEHIAPPAISDTICTRTVLTFTNTSSTRFTSRYYNLNEFYRKWNLYAPFAAQPQSGGGFSADSSICWYFEYKDGLTPARNPREFLPYQNNGTITSITDRPGCFTSNAFKASWRSMKAYGKGSQLKFSSEFSVCLKYCNDADLVSTLGGAPEVQIYPNPTESGVVVLLSPPGIKFFRLFDQMGRLINEIQTLEEVTTIDLSLFGPGMYTAVIRDERGNTGVRKLVFLK